MIRYLAAPKAFIAKYIFLILSQICIRISWQPLKPFFALQNLIPLVFIYFIDHIFLLVSFSKQIVQHNTLCFTFK